MDTIPGFRYVDGRLAASGVPLERVLGAVGSAWVYDAAAFDARAAALVKAFDPSWSRPCYAVKANTNPALLARARKHGLGAEVSSGGELKLALVDQQVRQEGGGCNPYDSVQGHGRAERWEPRRR